MQPSTLFPLPRDQTALPVFFVHTGLFFVVYLCPMDPLYTLFPVSGVAWVFLPPLVALVVSDPSTPRQMV